MSGEVDGEQQPLINGEQHFESYSVLAAVLPFLFPALGGFLYGYDIGSTSCATISIESATLSGITWYNLSSLEIGLITSGSLYGALIGSILAFTVADFLGRRRELMVAAVLYLVGAVVTALAPDFLVMVIGRFVFGIGIGLAMHAAPMYISETAPSQIRGQLISLKKFFIVLGMVLIMTGVAVLVIDRLGRRPLLLGGVSVMVISLFLLGSYYTFLDDAPVMAVVALLLYVGCYQFSFGPICWLMISEIFPLRKRGRGSSIAVLLNFGANAIVTFAFSPLQELLGAGILFYIFGGIAISSLFFIYFIVPET